MDEKPSAADEYEALPWQQREAVGEAISEGRAVDDPSVALLAAARAAELQRTLRRVLLVVLGVLVALAAGALITYGVMSDDRDGLDALAFGAALTIGLGALIFWAVSLRPLERARQANLHLAGESESAPSKHDVSNWVFAWLASLPVGWFIAAVLAAVGVRLPGLLGLVVWVGLLWALKRGFDARDRSHA